MITKQDRRRRARPARERLDLPSQISSGLSVPGTGGSVLGSAESILWRSFGFLAAGNFPNTLPENPENGFGHFPRACVVVRTRSPNRLGLVIVPAYPPAGDRKSTRLNSSHLVISYAVFCLKKKKKYLHRSI